jgi:hypothetical protein
MKAVASVDVSLGLETTRIIPSNTVEVLGVSTFLSSGQCGIKGWEAELHKKS